MLYNGNMDVCGLFVDRNKFLFKFFIVNIIWLNNYFLLVLLIYLGIWYICINGVNNGCCKLVYG